MTTAEQLEAALVEGSPTPPPSGPVDAAPGERGGARLGQEVAGLALGMRVRSDVEIDEIERAVRKNDALKVRDRLPRALRSQQAAERLRHACDPKIAAAARAWRPTAGNLLLIAETGLGKSTAAAYIVRRLLGIGIHLGGDAWALALRLQWFHALDLQDSRTKHPRGTGALPPEIEAACGASVLVIDDAGKEKFPDAVCEVVESRYDDGFPTVITSNLSYPGALTAHYGETVVRKMTEQGGHDAVIVDLTGGRA